MVATPWHLETMLQFRRPVVQRRGHIAVAGASPADQLRVVLLKHPSSAAPRTIFTVLAFSRFVPARALCFRDAIPVPVVSRPPGHGNA